MFEVGNLSLIYFTSDPTHGKKILQSGANSLLLDCEISGKTKRQEGFDTEININDPSFISEMRKINPSAHLMCRVNNADDPTCLDQVNLAISSGVNTIVLPLTEYPHQIRKVNKVIAGRANLIIMIETQKGVDNFSDLNEEQFDAIYIGLNDLSISRGGRPLFEPLEDGTVEYIISNTSRSVGVGGVTEPSMGYPTKSSDIIKHYAKLGVAFTVLRRSFNVATEKMPPSEIIQNIHTVYDDAVNNAKVPVLV